MDDETFYERVANELAIAGPLPGLWARAFAESDGDDNRAKALYLRLRVAQLKNLSDREEQAKQTAIAAATRERALFETELARRVDEERERIWADEQERLPMYRRKGYIAFAATLFALLCLVGLVVSCASEH